MPRVGKAALSFVRALLATGEARCEAGRFVAGHAALAADTVAALVSDGVIAGDATSCRSLPGTANWLKRQMIEADAFAAQHRIEAPGREGTTVNLGESPLARLASAAAGGEAFLRRHQVEAGERFRRLVDRARLQPRLTMTYSAAHTAGRDARSAGEIGDMAADARRALNELLRQLPPDCAGVVLDVCGFEKGLQQIELERGWPRRSAKLVLRIGLDRVAELWGIGETAAGIETHRRRAFMDGDRPAMFG